MKIQIIRNLKTVMPWTLVLFVVLLNLDLSAQERPNIILFITDDQSPIALEEDHVQDSRAFGFNGESKVYTPIIDNLAQNGIIFNRAYVSSSVCSPSRYAMLTGRYAGRLQEIPLCDFILKDR